MEYRCDGQQTMMIGETIVARLVTRDFDVGWSQKKVQG
jgi:hypothetical protein